FLSRLEKNPPKDLQKLVTVADRMAWAETDCLSCANCCKTMSPTYTPEDIRRISAHLNMTPKAFRDKWLYKDKREGDWMNTSQPCQFLNLVDNKCSIYEVRPADCAGFPHHDKKKMTDYMHVYKQNVEYCPATYKWVEKIMGLMKDAKVGDAGAPWPEAKKPVK
ncbi:MAG: YkgJ family cysteine cluster protein, partial [Bacteroidetes bacterium]|nr:YkgJ family cysteine cluster protein [Bacteroidota bacterium]